MTNNRFGVLQRMTVGMILFLFILTSCSFDDDQEQKQEIVGQEPPVPAETTVPSKAPSATPSATATATAPASPTATATPSPTATMVIVPDKIDVRRGSFIGEGDGRPVSLVHPAFGPILVLDEMVVHSELHFSFGDDDPLAAVLRFRNRNGTLLERHANIDPKYSELPIVAQSGAEQAGSGRYQFSLNSSELFSVFEEIENLVTLELVDQSGNKTAANILFSKHDYQSGENEPLALTNPQYDQMQLGIDSRTGQYAMQGRLADWLNDHPQLWEQIHIEIEDQEPLTWQQVRQNDSLLHESLEIAAYEESITFSYSNSHGEQQIFARDQVPYYTKFALVHSPINEDAFYTIRAGRDQDVSEELLQEMAGLVGHMFSNRPNYLDELAINGAVHSVAPGKDMRVLPEIALLGDDIAEITIDDVQYTATGIALLDRHPEISASAAYYYDNETLVPGFVLMHEVIHQVQYMIYGFAWAEAVDGYYQSYMELPDGERIPDIDYYESSPWEWDALLTPAWLSSGSDLHQLLEPYFDLEVGLAGTTIGSHLQQRWGDPLPEWPVDGEN